MSASDKTIKKDVHAEHGPRRVSAKSAPTVSSEFIDKRPTKAAAKSVPSVSLLNEQEQQYADVVAYTLALKRESLEEAKELISNAIDQYRHGQLFTEEELKKTPLHREFRNNYGDQAYKACLKRIKYACAVIDGHALMVEDLRFIDNAKVRTELHEKFIVNHGDAEYEKYLERLEKVGTIRRFQILLGNDGAINEAEINGIITRFNWDVDGAIVLHTLKTPSIKRDGLFQKYPGVQQIITECKISQEEQKDPKELCEDFSDSFYDSRCKISESLCRSQTENIVAMYPDIQNSDEFESLATGLFNKNMQAIASVFTGINESERKQRLEQLSIDLAKIQEASKIIKEQIHPLKERLSALEKKRFALNEEKEDIEKLNIKKNQTNAFITSVSSILHSVLSFMLPFVPSAEKFEKKHGNNKLDSRVESINRQIESIAGQTESIMIQIQAQEKCNEYVGKSLKSLENLFKDKQEEYKAIIGQEVISVGGNDLIVLPSPARPISPEAILVDPLPHNVDEESESKLPHPGIVSEEFVDRMKKLDSKQPLASFIPPLPTRPTEKKSEDKPEDKLRKKGVMKDIMAGLRKHGFLLPSSVAGIGTGLGAKIESAPILSESQKYKQ